MSAEARGRRTTTRTSFSVVSFMGNARLSRTQQLGHTRPCIHAAPLPPALPLSGTTQLLDAMWSLVRASLCLNRQQSWSS